MSNNNAAAMVKDLRKAKSDICVSIILPMHRFAPERQANSMVVKKVIEKVSEALHSDFNKDKAASISQRLEELAASIDFSRNLEGLGLYVSSEEKFSIDFPFPVVEHVKIGKKFELRELIQLSQVSRSFHVLLLSEKGARLFDGSGNDLEEIRDGQFPMTHEDDYAYSRAVRSSSYAGHAHVKNYERDKSELKATRLKDFFRKVDKMLDEYADNEGPVILVGAGKNISLYLDVAGNSDRILEKIEGNYDFQNEKELADRATPVLQHYFNNINKQLIQDFTESIGAGRGISGIQEIWPAAQEGKAFKLLVEMNYRQPGYLGENNYHLHLHPPQNISATLGDAVEEIIDIVLDKNGQVVIVGDGLLKDYGRIAMITRY